jgi:hypothetical protein
MKISTAMSDLALKLVTQNEALQTEVRKISTALTALTKNIQDLDSETCLISEKTKPVDQQSCELQQSIDAIATRLGSHRALNHDFFKYLKAEDGFNSYQYRIFRDNFFYRTAFTIPGVLHTIKSAILFGNYHAAWHVGRNMIDELGHNSNFASSDALHLKLLEDCFNEFGEVMFAVEKITIPSSENSLFLVPQAFSDRKVRKVLYESDSMIEVFATSWAHEFAADKMLVNLFHGIFLPYNGHYNRIEGEGKFKKSVSIYFDAHRDDSKDNGDIEAEHERIARGVLLKALKENNSNPTKSLNMIEAATSMFLDSQANLWDGIMSAMKEAKNKGPVLKKNH